MPWVGLQYVIIACPVHSQLLIVIAWFFYSDIAVCRFFTNGI